MSTSMLLMEGWKTPCPYQLTSPFSEADTPVNTGEHGDRWAEVSYIETRVSVHDVCAFVADLDILSMFGDYIQ